MMLDAKLEFSDAQAFTTAAAHDSTNVIDTGITYPDWGTGTPVRLLAKVNTTFTSGGSATLAVKLQESANNSDWNDTVVEMDATAVASLSQGYELLNIVLPAKHKRYLKLVYTVATAAMTAGAVDAFLALDVESYRRGTGLTALGK